MTPRAAACVAAVRVAAVPAAAASVACAVLCASLLFIGCAPQPKAGDPIRGLTPEQRNQFERGKIEFEKVFTPETGLGPTFNAEACAKCHESPVSGGPGEEVEIHVAAYSPEAALCDPLVQKGGFVIQ